MDVLLIVKIAAVGLVAAIACMLLKRAGKDEIATVVSVVGLVVALVMMLDAVAQLYDTLRSLFDLQL